MRFGVAGSDAPVPQDSSPVPAPTESDDGPARCLRCGLVVPAEARYCPDCGVRLTRSTTGSDPMTHPPTG